MRYSGKPRKQEVMNPNDIIDTIVDALDYAEMASDPQGLIKARRLLNNELRQAIDQYVQSELANALPPTPTLHRRRELAAAGERAI